MIEFTAYLAAQQRTADLARQALPDSPTIPEPDGPASAARWPAYPLRHRASLVLRRLADRVEPTPPSGRSPQPGCA